MLNRLPESGLDKFHPADGAYYIYADVGHLTDDSIGFSRRLLAEGGVAVAPGVDFDGQRGPTHIRLSFAGDQADVEEGLARIGTWLKAG